MTGGNPFQTGSGVLMDMDPGVDDAVALAVAAVAMPLAGVTTVAGNVGVNETTANAGRVLALLGQDAVPLVAGAAAPLFHPLVTAPRVHGVTGLDGMPPGPQVSPRALAAEDFWAESWMRNPGGLVATGPATNVARYLMGRPSGPRPNWMVWMGGSLSGGNVTPYAEFNAFVDPHAADWVLGAGLPLRVVGLDVTRKARFGLAAIARMKRLGVVGQALAAVLEAYCRRLGRPWAVLHDVVAVAAAVRPDLFAWQGRALSVVHDGRERGLLVPVGPMAGRPPVEWAQDLDLVGFYRWFWSCAERWEGMGNAGAR
ncbi:MAG: nucleoside hydrolase [Firmicutes bacterium]|nr:nucleoside hydrolase [Alicyclobacillaceae bacterium]MCL6497723.1 nucleoside hydrolase [Bacillota bacterium]